MSDFGGMDRGVPGDAPFLGRQVIYHRTLDDYVPATVMAVREDGWTVSLAVPGESETHDFVSYGGNVALGVIPVGCWVTPEEYEGAKIYAEQSAKEEDDGEEEGD